MGEAPIQRRRGPNIEGTFRVLRRSFASLTPEQAGPALHHKDDYQGTKPEHR
jgi:hypothetical protein